MSFAVVVRDVLSNTLPREGTVSQEQVDKACQAVLDELKATLSDTGVRNEVLMNAVDDPLIGQDLDGMVVGVVLDALTKVVDDA